MIIPIIAGVLSGIFLIGGIIPNYSNSKLEELIKENFLSKEVKVKAYSYPSFRVLSGNFDRIEINAVDIKIKDINIDKLDIIASPININYFSSKNNDLSFIKNSYLEFSGDISNNNFQKYINSKEIKEKANNIFSLIDFGLPFNLDNISLGNINSSFKNNRLNLSSNLNGFGGLVSVPINLSTNFRVTNKNLIEFFNPELEIFNQNIIFEKAQNLIEKLNPIFDINTLNNKDMKIKVYRIYFNDNKLKTIGTINFE